MSKKRSQRNNKKYLTALRKKRAKFHAGSHSGSASGGNWSPHDPNDQTMAGHANVVNSGGSSSGVSVVTSGGSAANNPNESDNSTGSNQPATEEVLAGSSPVSPIPTGTIANIPTLQEAAQVSVPDATAGLAPNVLDDPNEAAKFQTGQDEIFNVSETGKTVGAGPVQAQTIQQATAADTAQADDAQKVSAEEVKAVTTDQLRAKQIEDKITASDEYKKFNEASKKFYEGDAYKRAAQELQIAGQSGDAQAIAQAEQKLKQLTDESGLKELQDKVKEKQTEIESELDTVASAQGQISEDAVAQAAGPTMSERAEIADRDKQAEQAALSKSVGFDMSTKAFVDPITGETAEIAATPAAEAQQREAITDTTFSKGEATQIKDTVGYEAAKQRVVKGEAAKGAAVEMLAEVGELPEDISAAIVEDAATVTAEIDNQPAEVKAIVAALPEEALVSSQMENLLGSMDNGETPRWAKPAVDAVNAMLAKRGMTASTVGRDALFNAIIQSALPIAQDNAKALQDRARQNLDNRQQAEVLRSKLDMERRLSNLANRQTATSQTAQLANDMKKLQGTFDQQAKIASAEQDQQIRVENLRNRQRSAELNAQNAQDMAAANLANEQQMELANLEIEASVQKDNQAAENQERLAEMRVAADFLAKNAELKQQMNIANLSNEQQMRLANLQARNDAASDNLSASQQTELANLQMQLDTNLKAAEIAARMNQTQLTVDQQTALQNASMVANVDLAKFDAGQQTELVNSKFMQTMTMKDFDAENTAILQNATTMAQMDLATADQNTKLAINNANAFLAMDMANLENEQQATVLKAQQDQQKLLSDQSALNVAAQFNATSQQQTDQFMASMATNISQFNVTQANAMAQFNISETNKINALNAGNQLEADKFTAAQELDAQQFNESNSLQREQFNAANEQAIQQADLQWRRNTNTAATAAANQANLVNVQNNFALNMANHAQIWQQMKDEQAYIRQSYEAEEDRKASLYQTAIGNETLTSRKSGEAVTSRATIEATASLIDKFFDSED